jgi:GAF domain-containing protein
MMESTTILNQALQRLNQIGAAISQLDTDGLTSAETVLCMIVDSATDLVPGSSAIVYTYDEEQQAFDSSSRVSEEHDIRLEAEPGAVVLDDTPRPHGLGYRAVRRRGRVLSYEEADVDINPAKRAMGARVMVCYPLILSNEVLGVLYIYLHEDRHFTELELLMLENFVNLTAMTLLLGRRQMQVQQEQVRKDRELRRLRRAGILISSRSSLKATLETILQVALDITDAIYGIFRLVDSSGENLVTQAISGSGLEKPAVETLPINENSVMGLAALRRESIVIPDLWEEPWNNIYYPFDHRLEMRSELTVPLIGGSGRLEGVLNLESPLVNAFDRQDRYILQILATQAVVAIQEAHLLDTLQDISALLIRHSPELIYQSLVDHACDLLNVSRAMIWLKDKDTLLLQASNETSLPGLRIPAGETLTG